jgi:hypothetical protein
VEKAMIKPEKTEENYVLQQFARKRSLLHFALLSSISCLFFFAPNLPFPLESVQSAALLCDAVPVPEC